MKLRNKKTGKVVNCRFLIYNEPKDDTDYFMSLPSSLAEFNREWEYYKPKEPLIKDEKIRKAVRAWAEANDYCKDEEYQFEDFSTGWKSWALEHHHNGDYNEIHFNGGIDFSKMDHQSYYTIAELCGEEEDDE